jgi:hypothetical protein
LLKVSTVLLLTHLKSREYSVVQIVSPACTDKLGYRFSLYNSNKPIHALINICHLDFKFSPLNEYWFLVLGFLHGVRGEFSDDVSVAAVVSDTWSGNLPRTPCKFLKPKTKFVILCTYCFKV